MVSLVGLEESWLFEDGERDSNETTMGDLNEAIIGDSIEVMIGGSVELSEAIEGLVELDEAIEMIEASISDV